MSEKLRSSPYNIQLRDKLNNEHHLSAKGVQISPEHRITEFEYADVVLCADSYEMRRQL